MSARYFEALIKMRKCKVISVLKPNLEKIVWMPRSFSVLFALVILTLTAETFTKLSGFYWPAIGCGVILAVVAVTWNKPKFTGVFFLVFAIVFIVYLAIEKVTDPTAYSLMSGIPAIIGILFLTFGKNKTKKVKAPKVKTEAEVAQAEPEVNPE